MGRAGVCTVGEASQASDISDTSDSAAPETLTLARDEVHVWRVSLEQPGARVDELRALLSPEERGRAARFHFEKDRGHDVEQQWPGEVIRRVFL